MNDILVSARLIFGIFVFHCVLVVVAVYFCTAPFLPAVHSCSFFGDEFRRLHNVILRYFVHSSLSISLNSEPKNGCYSFADIKKKLNKRF